MKECVPCGNYRRVFASMNWGKMNRGNARADAEEKESRMPETLVDLCKWQTNTSIICNEPFSLADDPKMRNIYLRDRLR